MIVIGWLAGPGPAALCLDNLAEADFGPDVVSVVMASRAGASEIAHSRGSLASAAWTDLPARLAALGLRANAAPYTEAVARGGVFLAVDVADAEIAAAAAEMLGDAQASDVRTLPEA